MIQNKKYDIFTIITVVVTLTILSIGALYLAGFIGDFGDTIKEDADDLVSNGDISEENADFATDFIANDSAKYADNYVFWFFVATFVGLILTAIYLEFEPAVMIIIFIFGSVGILGAYMGSQIYGEFAEDIVVAEMSKTALLMSNPYFPIFIFVGLVVLLVMMYSKRGTGGYQ